MQELPVVPNGEGYVKLDETIDRFKFYLWNQDTEHLQIYRNYGTLPDFSIINPICTVKADPG